MNFLQVHRRPILGTAIAVVVVVIALLLFPHSIRAATGPISGTLANWLSGLLYFFLQMFANLLVVIINIMVAVASYNTFLNASAVEKGWVIVRDISNMFFIIVLLIISFGTILKLENYRYNKLLARLIIMAVLVNFSKFIAGFFIDFSQVIMLTFVNAWRDVAAGNITAALGLQQIIELSGSNFLHVASGSVDEGAILTAVVLGLFLVVVACIVMFIIALVLIMRILALWFLIVLSPLAYVLRTYPSTEKYAQRWWQEFGKYVIVGPVVAFLLWLSLAIMSQPDQFSADVFLIKRPNTTESSGVVKTPTGIDASSPEGQITASITKIGESQNLLSYIMGIMLLVGTLVITKEIGVAGGQMAGQWAEKIKGFGTKLATVGGAAMTFGVPGLAATTLGKPTMKLAGKAGAGLAKGTGNAVLDWAERVTGANLRPSEIAEQWKRGSKRRHERSREHVYTKALKRWEGQKAGTYTTRRLNWGRRKFGILPTMERVKGTKDIPSRPVLAGLADWEYMKVNEITPEALIGRLRGDRRKFTENTVAHERQKKHLQDLRKRSQEAADLVDPEEFYIRENTQAATRKRFRDLSRQIQQSRMSGPNAPENFRTILDKDGNKTQQSIDDVMKAEGIDPAANPATDRKKFRFLRNWDRERANEREPIGKIEQEERNRIMQSTTQEQRVQEGQARLRVLAQDRRNEAKLYEGPNAQLTEKSRSDKNQQLTDLKKALDQIDRDIKAKQAAGAPHTDLLTQRDEMRKNADYLARYLKDNRAVEDKDKKLSDEYAKVQTKQADRYDRSATEAITDTELKKYKKAVDDQEKVVKQASDEVAKYRPAVMFELQHAMRQQINEKQKQLLSDDWHEHAAVAQDALRTGDASLYAAALNRAAQYANENELMNYFGYDYSPGDFQKYITDTFEKTFHLSREQALSIGTDLSYTAEKMGHWRLARSTTIDAATGRREWQNLDDQEAEIVAEIRKRDAEGFARQTNRLGYGDEIVGLAEGIRAPTRSQEEAPGEWERYRQEKAAYFRSGGSREFQLGGYAMTYFIEKFGNMFRNMNQGRFNDSLAVSMSSPANRNRIKILEQLAQGVARKDESKKDRFMPEFTEAVRGYASAEHAETRDFLKEGLAAIRRSEAR